MLAGSASMCVGFWWQTIFQKPSCLHTYLISVPGVSSVSSSPLSGLFEISLSDWSLKSEVLSPFCQSLGGWHFLLVLLTRLLSTAYNSIKINYKDLFLESYVISKYEQGS